MNPETMSYDELYKYIIDPFLASVTHDELTTRALSVLYDKTQDKIESEIYQVEKGLDEDTVRNLEWEVEHLNMQINNLQEKIKNSFDENGVYVGDAITEAKEKEKELNATIAQLGIEVVKLERQVKEIPRLEDENRKLKKQVEELLERIYGE